MSLRPLLLFEFDMHTHSLSMLATAKPSKLLMLPYGFCSLSLFVPNISSFFPAAIELLLNSSDFDTYSVPNACRSYGR